MPRTKREVSPNGVYYIFTEAKFGRLLLADSACGNRFEQILFETKNLFKIEVFAYSLTKSQIHLLVKEYSHLAISGFMKKLCGDFSAYLNSKSFDKGSVFADRFKSVPTEVDQGFLPLIRFIHQTPARLKEHLNIFVYPFISYKKYFEKNPIVDSYMALNLLSKDVDEALGKLKIYHAAFEFTNYKPKTRLILDNLQIKSMIKSVIEMDIDEFVLLEKDAQKELLRKLRKRTALSLRQLESGIGYSRSTIANLLK